MKNRIFCILLCMLFLLSCKRDDGGVVMPLVDGIRQSINKALYSSYFTVEDLCRSDVAAKKGIDNTPSAEVERSLQALITNVLDSLRVNYGGSFHISSGYRSPALNSAIGGKPSSQHLIGEAVDITGGSHRNNQKLFKILVNQGKFDQLIWENGGRWIHISFRNNNNRGEILSSDHKRTKDISTNWEKVIARRGLAPMSKTEKAQVQADRKKEKAEKAKIREERKKDRREKREQKKTEKSSK